MSDKLVFVIFSSGINIIAVVVVANADGIRPNIDPHVGQCHSS
jgi:hypothetical protein